MYLRGRTGDSNFTGRNSLRLGVGDACGLQTGGGGGGGGPCWLDDVECVVVLLVVVEVSVLFGDHTPEERKNLMWN